MTGLFVFLQRIKISKDVQTSSFFLLSMESDFTGTLPYKTTPLIPLRGVGGTQGIPDIRHSLTK